MVKTILFYSLCQEGEIDYFVLCRQEEAISFTGKERVVILTGGWLKNLHRAFTYLRSQVWSCV